MSLNQKTVHVNGVDLNVVDTGSGSPALVFLHYWGGSSRTWAPVIERLSDEHRCVAIDFRGWGRSSKDATDYSLGTLADDAIQVIEKLRLEQFHVLGHSMGGKVAQLVAARRPAGLKSLILFAPAPPFPMNVPEEIRKSYIDLYQSRRAVADIVPITLTPHPLSDSARAQIIEDTLCGSAGAKEEWPLRGMIADISREASQITVPVHVIAGADDSIEPEDSLRGAFGGLLPQVTFSVLPAVGHIAPLEAPAKLADAIRSARMTRCP
jgi:pimeloyl-ACP methyl ester carboxylesterase